MKTKIKALSALLLTLFMIAQLCFAVSATETWGDVADYWQGGIAHDFGALTGMFHKFQGNYTNAVIPTNVKTFAQMYDGLTKGYVYTITQSYNISVKPNGLTDTIIDNTNPVFLTVSRETFDQAGITDTFPANTYRKNGSHADSETEDPTEYFKCSGYIVWRNQRATVKFIIEPLDDYYFLDTYFGLGCSFNDGVQSMIGSVVLSGMDIKATKAVTSDTYYQEQLSAMKSLESEVQTQGQATISAIDENGQQTRQSIDGAKKEISDSIKNQPKNEHDYVEQNKGNTDDVALPEVDISGIKAFAENLVSVVSTTETCSGLAVPAIKMPAFIGGQTLYPASQVDFSTWLNDEKIGLLIDFGKGVISIACLYGIVRQAYSLIQFALGTKEDSEA